MSINITKQKIFSVFFIIAIFAIVTSTVFAISEPVSSENSVEICNDGSDNDDDTLIDEADSDCVSSGAGEPVASEVPSENSYELCHDGLDNDEDTTFDMADSDCVSFEQAPTTNTETGGRSRGGSSRRTNTAPTANLAGGEVLGASTDAGSCKVLTTFMKFGSNNNVEEVKMLQTFLNTKMNAGLPVTGYFGPLTLQAVKNFQAQYATEILKPWVDAGFMTSISPTGYVYKTTLYAINKMLCPEAEIMAPVLN